MIIWLRLKSEKYTLVLCMNVSRDLLNLGNKGHKFFFSNTHFQHSIPLQPALISNRFDRRYKTTCQNYYGSKQNWNDSGLCICIDTYIVIIFVANAVDH